MSKLYRARSVLYRRQILQENMRWKARDETRSYKIYMLLHRSDLNILEKNRQTFSHFPANFGKIYSFSKNAAKKFDDLFSEILRSERCKSM